MPSARGILFFSFFSFFLLPCFSSLSLSLVPSFASLYLYPSNFQRRRLEEKKRTCTNNPDLSFLVFSFFLFLVSSLVLAGRFRNFFGIEVSRNRRGGRKEEGGRLESSIVRETTPSAILPHSDNKLRVLSFLDFQFIANFKWIKVFSFLFFFFLKENSSSRKKCGCY